SRPGSRSTTAAGTVQTRRSLRSPPVSPSGRPTRSSNIPPPRLRTTRPRARRGAEVPDKEPAAVVLRYGYALPYDQIADALDSSEDAARQAASSGVRRLRRRLT